MKLPSHIHAKLRELKDDVGRERQGFWDNDGGTIHVSAEDVSRRLEELIDILLEAEHVES